MNQYPPAFRHFATGWQMAEEAFLEYAEKDADLHAEFFARVTDDLIIGMLYGVDSLCDDEGVTDEAEREILRQAVIHGFSARWHQLTGGGRAGRA